MLLTSPLSSPLKNPVRDVFSPAASSQSLTAQVQALFAAGRVGGMWDMGDTSKLFQDSATLTTPVTAPGQTIGLVLDSKSTTVDATVITNGDFSVGTGWTMPAGVSISSGALRCTAASGYVYQNAASMTSGDVYKVTYTVSNYSGGSIKAYVNASAVFSFTVSANGVSTGYIRAGSSNREVGFSLIGFTGDIDDFSVCRVPGNHATQPTAGARPLFSARKNQLQKTEVFTDAAWSKLGVTVTANNATAPDGTLTASTITFPSSGGANQIYQNIAVTSTPVTQGVWLRSASTVSVDFGFYDSASDVQTISVTSAWTYFTKTRASGLTGGDRRSIWIYPNAPATIEIWHPQVEVGSAATSYQRVNTGSDYDTVGFPAFAKFDGANDLLQVSGINLSTTNKVLIGLAFKPNTTAASIAMEYSPTAVSNVGAFYASLNEGGSGKHYLQANNGGGGLDAVTPSSALPLAYTTLIDYIDLAQLTSTVKHSVRVNGASAGITSVIDGPDVTGNFGNYDLFLGARSGGLYPSNMNIHRAFIRAGAATAGEQLILENWLRESCGV